MTKSRHIASVILCMLALVASKEVHRSVPSEHMLNVIRSFRSVSGISYVEETVWALPYQSAQKRYYKRTI